MAKSPKTPRATSNSRVARTAPKRTTAQTRQTAADIARLKDEFVDYFVEVPVQKYAAMAIGRTEQTVIEWLKSDEAFFNRVQEARAKWVKKKASKVRAEFALERLEKDVWAERKEVTGKDGGPIELKPVEVMAVGTPQQEAPAHANIAKAKSNS